MDDHRKSKSGLPGEWPAISERHWEVLTLTFAILTFIGFCVAFGEIFFGPYDDEKRITLVKLLTPFGVFGGAIVTFCSVNWRGKITTRQANVAERESRAKLLQEGAKLLGEDGRSHILAGIATLSVLVVGDDEAFAIEAMNLLADYLSAVGSPNPDSGRVKHILATLSAGERIGRRSTRSVYLQAETDIMSWPVVRGVYGVHYTGGTFTRQHDDPPQIPGNAFFDRTRIVGFHDLVVDGRFQACRFELCRISEVKAWSETQIGAMTYKTLFSVCDFSDAVFAETTPRQLLKEGNFYMDGQPPHFKGGTPAAKHYRLEKFEP